ncbi:hypothetical protein [Paraburkholderia azotifigens]|uniref:hypothetical protein n=1 Tax=Paraburkholderia azotifigens TaxID=2057004 RepID=UPI0038B9882B
MTEQQLMQDLTATFPGLRAEVNYPFSTELVGLALKADTSVLMPDGQPIFDDFGCERDHDNGVHVGFHAWLERRGWYIEPYGYGSWCAIPLPSDEETRQWKAERAFREVVFQGPKLPDDCPF